MSAVEELLVQCTSEATTSRSSRSRRVRAISQGTRRAISVSRVVSGPRTVGKHVNERTGVAAAPPKQQPQVQIPQRSAELARCAAAQTITRHEVALRLVLSF